MTAPYEPLTPEQEAHLLEGAAEGWPLLIGFPWIDAEGRIYPADPPLPIKPGGKILTTGYVVCCLVDYSEDADTTDDEVRVALAPRSIVLWNAALAAHVARLQQAAIGMDSGVLSFLSGVRSLQPLEGEHGGDDDRA